MDILRSVLGTSDPGPQVTSAEHIERMVERANTSTLLEDRRDACRALKAMSRKFRLEVGAQGLNTLINVLKTDSSDTEIISYVLDTLCNICSPEDFDEEVVDEDREDLTGIGEGFSEMFLKDKDNLTLILGLMEEFDFKIRRPSVQLLSDLLTNCVREVQAQILESHVGISRLMDILGETREVLRNDALILLFKVTKGNANLQKIVAFENAFDKLFEILEAEGWTDGGIVAEDCLRLLLNLLRNNTSNQTFFKEGGYITRLKPGLEVVDTEDYGWDAQKVANMLSLLQVVKTLVSPSNPATITSVCQQATNTSGVMGLLIGILLASGIPADVLTETINTLSEVIRGNNENQESFMAVSAPSQPPRPAIILLLMSMVNDKQPFSLRCAVLYCFQSYLLNNTPGKSGIVSSLLPTSEQSVDISAGQLLCGGLFCPDPVSNWLCSAALSHLFRDSNSLNTELLRVQLSTVAGGQPVSLLCQALRILQHTPHMVTKLGLLQLLCSWSNECPQAVNQLLQAQDSLSFLLNQIGSNEHDETERLCHGLCAVLLGLAVLHNDGSVPGHSSQELTTLLEKRVGSEVFLDKLGDIPKHEAYIRALKSPQVRAASVTDLTFDHMFCELFRSLDRDLTNIIKKSNGTPSTNGQDLSPEALSGEVEQYKDFIRQQDQKMGEFVSANQLLHSELTKLRVQHEEVCSSLQQVTDQNAILQAQAINAVTSTPLPAQAPIQTTEASQSVDSVKMLEVEAKLKHQDEYIQELEARLNTDNISNSELDILNDNYMKLQQHSQTQALEMENMKQQLGSLREIMMSKDEEIMKLKNDIPLRKSDKPVDRFENMFMTSMELESQKKTLNGLEVQLKTDEIIRLKEKHEGDLKTIEKERDEIERELRETRHKVDALEELTKNFDKETVTALECELRDTKCKLEELQELRDSKSMDVADSSHLEKLLKEAELRLNITTENLLSSRLKEQELTEEVERLKSEGLSSSSELKMLKEEVVNKESDVTRLKEDVASKTIQLETVSSEQEDLLVMLADQEEKISKLKETLRSLGHNVVESDNDEEDIT